MPGGSPSIKVKAGHTETGSLFILVTTKHTMRNLTKILLTGALLGAVSSHAQVTLLAGWDFNENATFGDSGSDFTDSTPDAGTISATLLVDLFTSSSGPFEISANGTTTNDFWNSPAEAGNTMGFLHGSRNDGTTVNISFDASSISTAVTMSFAFNRDDVDGVDTYQASYSTDGTNFTDLGSLITITSDVDSWATQTINFGTVLAGASSATVRITLGSGGATWDENHRSYMDNVGLTTVPEPSTFVLLGGVAALGFVLFRRRKLAA